jgi:UDP-GlcNAc3NAcA epimerase
MKLLSVIGTRPQYVKIKPFVDFCKTQKYLVHVVLDTRQHFSNNVSDSIIADLDLQIDFYLDIQNRDELCFMRDAISGIYEYVKIIRPDAMLVYGDTNSTFCAALVAYKLGIPLAHVEAGMRCGDVSVPEEINRVFVDLTAKWKFCSTREAVLNVTNGVFCGDLEYEYLNRINPEVTLGDFAVMTIHRQENISKTKLQQILDLCSQVPHEVRYYTHHRAKSILSQCNISKNVISLDPITHSTMIEALSRCRYILTDSGGIQKVAPFFGKGALVVRSSPEWKDLFSSGYAHLATFTDEDVKWLEQSIYLERSPRWYMSPRASPSQIIYGTICQGK